MEKYNYFKIGCIALIMIIIMALASGCHFIDGCGKAFEGLGKDIQQASQSYINNRQQ